MKPPENTSPEPKGGTPRSAAGRALRWVSIALGSLIVLVLVVLLAVILILQTEWGAEQVKNLAIQHAPLENAELQIDRLGGSFVRSLHAYDVNIVHVEGHRMAHVDTLRVRYRLTPLLFGRLQIEEAEIIGPDVSMTQQEDATWDLLNAFPEGDPEEEAELPFSINVRQAALRGGQGSARFYPPEADSIAHIQDLNVLMRNFFLDDEDLAFSLDTLRMQSVPPGSPDPVQFRLSAAVDRDRLSVSELLLSSPHTNVTAQGLITLPNDAPEDTDFTLTADPLAFRDLHPFASSLDPDIQMFLDASLSGNMELLRAQVDGRFSDEATFSFTAEATPGTDPAQFEMLRYALNGSIRNLDPNIFTAQDPTTAGIVNADVEVDVQGPLLEQLNGIIRADVFDTRIGEITPDPTSLRIDFTEGTGDVSLSTGVHDSQLAVTGTVRPFDEVPAYDLATRFENIDAGAFAEGDEFTTSLTGSLHVDGHGIDLETARTNLVMNLEPSTINTYRLVQGQARLALDGGRGGLSFSLRPEEGSVLASGSVDLRDEPAYAIHVGRIQNVNVAALTGDTTSSSLNATFTLEGRGVDPETMRLDHLSLNVLPSHYGDYIIETASVEASLEEQELAFSGLAQLDGGTFTLNGTGFPFEEEPRFEIPNATFQNVDIGVLAQQPDQHSDLSGSAALSLQGTDPETMFLDGSIQLIASQLNEQPIQEGSMDVTLRQGRMDSNANVLMPDGSLELAATGRFFDEVPQYQVTEAFFEGINLGALTGQPDFYTRLSGTGWLEGVGVESATMVLDAQMELHPSVVNEQDIPGGFFTASLANGLARLDGELDFEPGHATFTGQGHFFEETDATYTLSAMLEEVQVTRLMGRDDLASSLSLTLDLQGEGLETETMTLTGQVETRQSHLEDFAISRADADFSFSEGLLQLDTMVVESNVLMAVGSGPVAVFDPEARYRSDFRFEGQVEDLAPLGTLMETDISLSEGQFEGRLYGPPGRLGFEATSTLSGLSYNALRVADIEIFLIGEFDQERQLDVAEIRSTFDTIAFPGLLVETADLELIYDGEQASYVTDVTIDRQRTLQMAGLVDLLPEDPVVHLTTFDMNLDDDQWELLQTATITMGEEIRVRNLLIFAEDQQIALDGSVDFDGEQNLLLTVEDVRMDPFADLMDFQGLGGRLSGYVDLVGPAEDPRLEGHLTADVRSFDTAVGDLSLDLLYEDLSFNIDVVLTHQDGSTLSLAGSLPFDLRLDPEEPFDEAEGEVDMALTADAFAIGWVLPFLDRETVNEISGQLTANIDIGGTRESPQLSGAATLQNGVLGLPGLGVRYADMAGRMELEGNQVELEQFTLRVGRRGRLAAHGTIDLAELTLGEFDLSVEVRNFLAINTREYRVVTDSDLTVTGTTQAPVVRGSVRLISADFYIDQPAAADLEAVELTEDDVQTVEQRFGIRVTPAEREAFDIYEAADIELSIQMQRDVWVRSRANPEMNIQITGSLDFEKHPDADELAFGEISVIPERSFINQFGRRFEIEHGSLIFSGPVADPVMDIQAVYEVRARRGRESEATIRLAVEGTLDQLEIDLSSDPAMEMTDIVSYIVTGRPASEGFMLGGGGPAETNGLLEEGVGLAFGQVANLIEQFAGRELGLDVIEIDQRRDQGTTITAGRYVTRRFFVSVSQPITLTDTPVSSPYRTRSFAPSVMLEYTLFDWLMARMAREDAGLRVNFFWEYAY